MKATTISFIRAGQPPWRGRVCHSDFGTGTIELISWTFTWVRWDSGKSVRFDGDDRRELTEIGR